MQRRLQCVGSAGAAGPLRCSTLCDVGVLLAQAEGVDLMWMLLSNKRQARLGALRVLDYVTTRNPPACDRVSAHACTHCACTCAAGRVQIRACTAVEPCHSMPRSQRQRVFEADTHSLLPHTGCTVCSWTADQAVEP